MKNSFLNIYEGLQILMKYSKDIPPLTFEPVPQSFSNGSPNFSRNAYMNVEMGADGWRISEGHRKKLIDLGWIPEDEDQYWIHYGD